jgi:hypothetical protein
MVATFFSIASACSAEPFTQTLNRTAIADGSTYTALPAIVTLGQASTEVLMYTFPNWLLTALTPGEKITLVPSNR